MITLTTGVTMTRAKANKLYKQLVTDKDKTRVPALVRYRLVHETGHNWCSKCEELMPIDRFAETTTNDVGYLSYCKDHSSYTSNARTVEVFKPARKLKPEALVKHYNDLIAEELSREDSSGRVPRQLIQAINGHEGEGVAYCKVCRYAHIVR